MKRFVILHHVMPDSSSRASHWDFMLEQDGILKTWALDRQPVPNIDINAIPLPDHRPDYLNYEGPVSGDRGRVIRFDAGPYVALRFTDAYVEALLMGEKIAGDVVLQPTSPGRAHWSFRFTRIDPIL